MRTPILPPDAPPEIKPVPYDKKPLSVLETCTPAKIRGFAAIGVRTLGDLDRYIEDGGEYTDASYVGEKSAPKIKAEHARWRADYASLRRYHNG